MKHGILLASICLCMTLAARGQDRSTASAAQAQTAAAQPPQTVASSINAEVNIIERELIGLAEAMPEDKYGFAPTNGEFKGVRTFAEQMKHVAAVNYGIWSGTLNEKPPFDVADEKGPDSIKTKAQIVQFLKDSFELGHRAAQALTTENMLAPASFNKRNSTRLFWTSYAVAHGFDHYGQSVVYLRMNGIIPPQSRASR
jgi:uncharacterized damage-inducible protein DinB